jgi:hypothetical protein
MQHGMIDGMVTTKDAPAEYWKFLDSGKTDPKPVSGPVPVASMCTISSHSASCGLKRRSPEFLADTSKALKFAATHFTPATIKRGKLANLIDLDEFCTAILGPVTSRRQAFQLGPWVPPGFDFPGVDKPRPTRRVGKRLADALMAHYGLEAAAGAFTVTSRKLAAAIIEPEPNDTLPPLSPQYDLDLDKDAQSSRVGPQAWQTTIKAENDSPLPLDSVDAAKADLPIDSDDSCQPVDQLSPSSDFSCASTISESTLLYQEQHEAAVGEAALEPDALYFKYVRGFHDTESYNIYANAPIDSPCQLQSRGTGEPELPQPSNCASCYSCVAPWAAAYIGQLDWQ